MPKLELIFVIVCVMIKCEKCLVSHHRFPGLQRLGMNKQLMD